MDDKILWLAIQLAKYKRWHLPLAEITAVVYLHKAHRWNPAKSKWSCYFSTVLLSWFAQMRRSSREDKMEQPRYLNFWLLRAEMKKQIEIEKRKIQEEQDRQHFLKMLTTPITFPKV